MISTPLPRYPFSTCRKEKKNLPIVHPLSIWYRALDEPSLFLTLKLKTYKYLVSLKVSDWVIRLQSHFLCCYEFVDHFHWRFIAWTVAFSQKYLRLGTTWYFCPRVHGHCTLTDINSNNSCILIGQWWLMHISETWWIVAHCIKKADCRSINTQYTSALCRIRQTPDILLKLCLTS